ncbi:MAG: crossover junction endodeoxyribonuclease RuvC [Sinomicrobium sp.]|nr:crossover junction endodeoxyribonuclease RuvC [Candidatus Omnitrophota bacterium]MCB0374971.1 crossover junction endodeoxyribonuclease RuvC [Sinomicrobium sp.]
MKILGIDPGLKATGYGLLEHKHNKTVLVEAGTIHPKVKDSLEKKLLTVYRQLHDLIREHKPQTLVLEKIYAHYKHPATASILGHTRGVICLLCAQSGIYLAEHSVKRIRKAVTGNGNASKEQTRRMVANEFGLKPEKLTLDASDAIALAAGYLRIHGRHL